MHCYDECRYTEFHYAERRYARVFEVTDTCEKDGNSILD